MVKQNLLSIAALTAASLGVGALGAQAQGTLITSGTIVVAEGDQAPGMAPGILFGGSAVDFPALDETGNVFFRGRMQGTGLLPTNDRALYYGASRASLQMVVRSGDPVPTLTNGETLNTATGTGPGSNARLSSNGNMMWVSAMTGGLATSLTDTAIFTGTPGSYVIAAREGDPAPGTVGATIGSSLSGLSTQPTGINNSGRILFQSATLGGDTTSANNAAWFGGTPGNLELIMRKGHTLGTGEVVGSLGFASQQTPSGVFLHDESLSTVLGTPPATAATNGTMWMYTPGGTPGTGTNTLIAREGDAAVGTTGAVYGQSSAFATPFSPSAACLNNAGEAIMLVSLFGGDVSGTVNDNALYKFSVGGGMQMVFRKGDAAPGLAGGELLGNVNTSSMVFNNNGRWAMQISLQGGSVTTADDSSVWTGTTYSDMQMIAREGAPAPFTVGATLGSMSGLGNFYLNDLGQITFMAPTVGGDTVAPNNDQVYYAWDPTLGTSLLLRKGDALEITPGVFRTITTWGGTQFHNGDGRGLSFNHGGRLVMKLNWNTPTNSSAIVITDVPHATPTTPFCLGDGTGAACPCANPGAAGHGCASSAFAGGAILSSSGVAGASLATDSLVLTATDIPGPGLFFQADGLSPAINFGDGHLCAAVNIIRLGVVFPTAGIASYPGGLTPNPIHVAGLANNGDTKHYQCWYRSVPGLCNPSNFDLTQGLTLTWGP